MPGNPHEVTTVLSWLQELRADRVELLALALLVMLGPLIPRQLGAPFRAARAWLARRPTTAVAGMGFLGVATTAALALTVSMPEPHIHDEFSYLLAADTYVHGRPANPTPREWESFETFHVIMQPAYASKYPPGQGLILALGQRLGGHPVAGLWLSVGLACAALTWMLQAWVRPRWALVGGLIAVIALSSSYFGHSYWGGAVAVIGGALIYGAVPRLLLRPAAGVALVFAAGLLVLANSRPYEGLVVSIPAGLYMVQGFARWRGAALRAVMVRAGLPIVVALLAGASAMAWYNYSVTGDAAVFPYMAYERDNAAAPLFVWQAQQPLPLFRNPEMTRFAAETSAEAWRNHHTLKGFRAATRANLRLLWSVYLGPALSVCLIGLWWRTRRGAIRFLLAALALFLAGLSLTNWHQPHYAAPAYGLALLLVVEGLRWLRHGLLPRATRPALVGAVLLALCLGEGLRFLQRDGYLWDLWPERRAVLAALAREPGRDLVFVRYTPRHDLHREWVQNGAEFSEQAVLWARHLGPAADARVVDAYPGRRVWWLDADRVPPRLTRWASPP